MDFVFQSMVSQRNFLYYIIAISVLRGIAFPDFRHGVVSVVIIQMAYPLLLLLPLLIGKTLQAGFWACLLMGVTGIVLSEIVAVSRYAFEHGIGALLDSVTGAIFILSFAAMTGMFAAILALVIYWHSR